MGVDGGIIQVRCKICTDVEGYEKLLVPKIDSLMKHAGRRKAAVDMGKVKRGKYERVFFAKGGLIVAMKLMVGGPRSGAGR
jgi:hypothetical protein